MMINKRKINGVLVALGSDKLAHWTAVDVCAFLASEGVDIDVEEVENCLAAIWLSGRCLSDDDGGYFLSVRNEELSTDN